MPRVSERFAATPFSAIREFGELARRRPGALRLEIGDPDFATASHITEAAAAAARAGMTHYAPSAGLPSLRSLIVAKVDEHNGIQCGPDEVVVTAGACGGLFTTFLTLLDAGDEVLVPDPGWPNYLAILHNVGASAVPYRLDPATDFRPDIDSIASGITPRTRAIIVNSPSNPTGAVLDEDALHSILRLAEQYDLWVISDECYEDIVFDGRHVSLGSLPSASDRVISVFSFSKSYAMTGWRVGYVVAPTRVARLIGKAQEPVHSCVSPVTQKAAEAALGGPQVAISEMREAYRRRRDSAVEALTSALVPCARPAGAFYLMVGTPKGENSMSFAMRLLDDWDVAAVPGRAFGEQGEGWLRIALCVADDVLAEGIHRIVNASQGSAPTRIPTSPSRASPATGGIPP
ncbi:MAG: pyridoxal phosphate-dependent aminotransferase [Candidatus Limnocylindrales bacterium]|jgi:aspartate/methionine/tyrosine aminotransferase